jgi:hypothetical protein
MNLVGQDAHKDGEFEINWPFPNLLRIPTGRPAKSPVKWAQLACSPLVNHHGKGCESAGGHDNARKAPNGEQAWP